jgi:hypothetical protein
VKVEAPFDRRIENGLGQQEAIGDNHGNIGIERGKLGLLGFALEAFGCEDGDTEGVGRLMYRALALSLTATSRLGRSGIDRDDLMAGRDNLGQRRNGKIGRTHEDDAHGVTWLHCLSLL